MRTVVALPPGTGDSDVGGRPSDDRPRGYPGGLEEFARHFRARSQGRKGARAGRDEGGRQARGRSAGKEDSDDENSEDEGESGEGPGRTSVTWRSRGGLPATCPPHLCPPGRESSPSTSTLGGRVRKTRFTEEQIVAALKLAESGARSTRSAGSWP